MGQNSTRGKEQVNIQINHPKFAQAKLLHRFDKQILKTVVSCDQKTFKAWKQLLSQYKDIDHEYLLLPRHYYYKPTAVCATRGQVEIQYDNNPYLLTDQIYNRKGKKAPFNQPQLWYLLYAYLSAKNYLNQKAKYPHSLIGDIRPDNVFLNYNGQVRFSNLFSWPGQKINYKKTFDGVVTYLSPQDIELLQLGCMNNQKNLKSQFFSIGFTLVSAAILKDNSDCYDVYKQKFNTHQAKKRINAFKCSTVYSQLLRAIISSLCGFQAKRRIQFSEIWLWITKYQRRIISKQSFMIDEVPPKINEHINILRSDIVTINPQASILSVKSLRQSQQRNQVSALILDSKIKKQIEKRTSRIIINSGADQKVFFSPKNGYFKSQVSSPSQVQYFHSPPPARNANFVASRVQKSADGFYSPKNVGNSPQQFRVFIQYKSPTKKTKKPLAETIYVGKNGQNQNTVKVQNMQINKTNFKKKDSDAKSQNSGDSNRQNRFIQQTIKQNNIQQVIKSSQTAKKVGEKSDKILYKKQSPINKIISSQEIVAHGVSQVISQQIILPKDHQSHKKQRQSNLKQTDEQTSLIKQQSSELAQQIKQHSTFHQNIQIKQFVKTKPLQQQYRISFSIKQAQPEFQQKDKILQAGHKSREQNNNDINYGITAQYLQKFDGINLVHRDTNKKVSIHEPKSKQQERSRQQQEKKLIQNLSEANRKKHQEQQQLNRQTFDDGHHRIPPKTDSAQSFSVKFQIPQRHKDVKPFSTIQQLEASINSMPSYLQSVSSLTPIQRSIIKKQEPIQFLDEELQKQTNEIIIQFIDYDQIVQKKNQNSFQQTEKTNQLQLKSQNYEQQIKPQNSNINIIIQQNIQSSPIEGQNVNKITIVQHTLTQQIIDNQISAEKQPQQLLSLNEANNIKHQNQQFQTIVDVQIANNINRTNILILDDNIISSQRHNAVNVQSHDFNSPVNQNNLIQQIKSSQYQGLILSIDGPLIHLGPQNKHQQIVNHQSNKIDVLQTFQAQKKNHEENSVQQMHKVQDIEHQSVQGIVIQKVQNLHQELIRSASIKKPQSPFQLIQAAHIQQNSAQPIHFQQRVIVVDQNSSKLQSTHQLLQAENIIRNQNQRHQVFKQNHKLERQVQIIEKTNQKQGQQIYTSVSYQHQISLGGNSDEQKVDYNVVETANRSLPLQLIQQLDIQGSGRVHSRFINNSSNGTNNQATVVQSNDILVQNHHTIIQSEQKIALSQVEEIHKKFNVLKNHNNETKIQEVVSQKVIICPTQTAKDYASRAKNLSQTVKDNILVDGLDNFLKQVVETNYQLSKIKNIQGQIVQPAPFILPSDLPFDNHFIDSALKNIKPNRINHQGQKYTHQTQIASLKRQLVQQQTQNNIVDFNGESHQKNTSGLISESHQKNTSNFNNGSQSQQIKNSQITFEIVKQVIGKSKDIHQLYQTQPQNKNATQLNQQNLQKQENTPPLNSNQNNTKDEVYLQISSLKQTIQGQPIDSQFGNISEIMDINIQFNNTLNGKQINFLELTQDPKSNQFLKELLQKSARGQVQKQHIQRIKMTQQDRQKLNNFLQRFNLHQTGQNNIQQAIEQFRYTLSNNRQVQHDNASKTQNQTDAARLHMSVQDKQKLGFILNNINRQKEYHSMEQLQINDKQTPANYRQSNVDIKYSELRTQIKNVQKQDSANVVTQQDSIDELQQIRKSNQRKGDIIDEVMQINQSIKKSQTVANKSPYTNSNQFDKQEIFIMEKYQKQDGFSLENNFNKSTQQNLSSNNETLISFKQHSLKQYIHSSSGYQKINDLKSTRGLDIVDEAIHINQQLKQLKGSQVNASVGTKSQRQDPITSQIQYNIGSQTGQVILQSFKYHRAYSQPNNLLQNNKGQQEIILQKYNLNLIQNTQTIVQQIHQQHHEQIADKVALIQHPAVTQTVSAIKINQQKINEEPKISTSRSSQRRSRPKDFLDDVMAVNKIVNTQEDKDYYQNNKFLAAGPAVVQLQSQANQQQKSAL